MESSRKVKVSSKVSLLSVVVLLLLCVQRCTGGEFSITDTWQIWVTPPGPGVLPGNGESANTPFNNLGDAFALTANIINNYNVIINLMPGTYYLLSGSPALSLSGGGDLIIRGNPHQVIIDCKSQYAYLADISSISGFHMENLYIRNCYTSAYVYSTYDNSITDCQFENLNDTFAYFDNIGNLFVTNAQFRTNEDYYNVVLDVQNSGPVYMVDSFVDGGSVEIEDDNGNPSYLNNTVIMNSPISGLYVHNAIVYLFECKIVFNEYGIISEYNGGSPSRNSFTSQAYVSNNTLLWANNRHQNAICYSGSINLYESGDDICFLDINCMDPQSLDKCLVCGGNDGCVGCDGLPNSNAVCNQQILPGLPRVDDPNSYYPVSFTGYSPNPTIYAPKIVAGNVTLDPNFALEVKLISISEYRPDGSLVAQYLFDQLVFFLSRFGPVQVLGQDASQAVYDYYFSSSKGHIRVTHTYYPSSLYLTDHGIPFYLAADTLKLTVEIDDWPYESNLTTPNHLELVIQTRTGEPEISETSFVELLLGSFGARKTRINTANTVCSLSFFDFAWIVRNASADNGGTESLTVSTVTNVTSSSVIKRFTLAFPAGYTDSIVYDPDFSVTLEVKTSDEGDGDTDLGLIIGLSVSLPLAALFVIVVIIIGTIILTYKRKAIRNKLTTVVNRGSDL